MTLILTSELSCFEEIVPFFKAVGIAPFKNGAITVCFTLARSLSGLFKLNLSLLQS